MSALPTADGLTRSERLDRLPFTRKHGRLLGTAGIGWALDAMDVGLISFVIAALAQQWALTSIETSWIASIGFVGMAIGATVGGLLADRIGRRSVFALTLLVYGIATGASALVGSLAALLVLRFMVGLGLGAELPVASTLISEFAPKKIRGRVVVWLEAFWAVGWIIAAVIGTFVVSASDDGWRWGLAIGMAPAIFSIAVRWGMPESVRYLLSKGRVDEAERTVREFEAAAEVPAPAGPSRETETTDASPSRRTDGAVSAASPDASAPKVSIWSPMLRRRTIALWTVWFCINFSYYGAFIWIPSLLVDQGFSLVRSFEFTLIITVAQLPGYAAAAFLIEKWGRRPTLTVFLIGSACAAAWYGTASTEAMIIAAGCTLSFFNLGAWGALYAIGPELYPTNVRGTGTGAAAGFGRIASIIAPLTVPFLISGGGPLLLFGVFALAFAIAAIAAWTLPEQRGTALE
ncbi:MFS transporter, putative metabolite:H+ symporter [Agrococcus baldri]|uniref:MFS transporter, putative metabolite:H+ symporter n=1 Tax=Agrococcus baldri TaxID=153730 RepID=A0AA94HLA8_9MICO|nr:MFS transporter [Agrococcus baldri]SFS06745.1 MFS transporter, putative metabolite:H+ symporter [Agrococcus baldri]